MKKNNTNKGVATLEIVLALAIIIFAITAVTLVVSTNDTSSISSGTTQEALYLAKQGLEQARNEARVNFPGLTTKVPIQNNIYSTKLGVTESVDGLTKIVVSTVTWGTREVNLETVVTNWNSAESCSDMPTGDWANPLLLGFADFGESSGATSISPFGNKVYATANPGLASAYDFYVIDTTNPHSSVLPIIGKLNTGPGLASVFATGQYAYVANMSTTAQLQVIDTNSVSLLTSSKVTPPGDSAVGNSIFYRNKKVYLGLTKSNGPEFYVIDVSTPSSPVVLASFEINSKVSSITVSGDYAFLAVPDDVVTPGGEQLKILDVSQADSGIINLVNSWGMNPTTMSGQSIYLTRHNKKLYLGEGGANSSHKPEFFELDSSSPWSIPSPGLTKYLGATVGGIIVRGGLAYIMTASELKIFDLNNLGTVLGSVVILQGATGGLGCVGNLIYIAQRNTHGLQIVGPGAGS